MKPFIEISVLESKIPAMEILTAIEKKFTHPPYSAKVEWKGNAEQKQLIIEFSSREAMEKAYNVEIPVYDGFLELLTSDLLTNSEFKNLFPLPLTPISSEDLFLVLKYTTNVMDILRLNYQYIFRIASMMGMICAYEEVMDGFFFYHARREDYDLTLLPLNHRPSVEKWLKTNHLWNDKFQEFLDVAYQFLNKPTP